MRVGVAQITCEVGRVDLNTQRMLGAISEAGLAGCDTVVFPEMSDTGYVMATILQTASTWKTGPILALREAAQKTNVNIVAGLSERTEHGVFNTIAAINRDGALVAKYRKTHLITAEPMLEDHYLCAGDETVVGVLDGIRVGFLTCYDIRFPEMSRLLSGVDANIIFVPAAFPRSRIAHWTTLVDARAIENQIFMVAANRVGTDGPGLIFGGASRIIDPYGIVLASASNDEEKLLLADLDMARVAITRKEVQVNRDRRPNLYSQKVKIYGSPMEIPYSA